jgi:hypothetical protein
MTDSGAVAPQSESLAARLRAVPAELRNAGIAAAALAASLILPWYQKSFVPSGSRVFVQDNLSAWGVFSFVEAAILLVAVGVVFLVWARANRRAFHLPGGDGAVIFGAGCWALALLVWRLFDKPNVDTPAATVGIQWGIFVAFVAAGALAAAGARVRAAHRPEPPNPVAEEPEWEPAPPRAAPSPDRRPREASAVTEVLRDRPGWQGEPPSPPQPARRREGEGEEPSEAATTRHDPSEADTRVVPPPPDRLF